MRLEPEQARRVRKHRPWIWSRESFAFQQLEKNFRMSTAQIRIASTLWRRVAEVTPTFDDLLRRAAADPELQSAVADQIGRARVLDHVERILVPHVDHGRSDLDATRPGADGRKQREGGRELLGKVMNAKVCAIRPQLLGRHCQLDRLL